MLDREMIERDLAQAEEAAAQGRNLLGAANCVILSTAILSIPS
jgi:hypothetical protein